MIKPLHWAGVALVATFVGFLTWKKSPAAASVDPKGLEPAKDPAKDPTGTETVIGTSESSYIDANGVNWSLYKYTDGRWEGNALEADPKYVKVYNEATKAELRAMIDGHAATYNANGMIKAGEFGTELPDYKPNMKCATGYQCWVMVDPNTVAPVPMFALTSPLKVGDIVTYYLSDEPDATLSTYLLLVTARVTGAKIAASDEPNGKYPIEIVNATLLRGKAPTKLPPVGFALDQYRIRMIGGSIGV